MAATVQIELQSNEAAVSRIQAFKLSFQVSLARNLTISKFMHFHLN